MNSLILRDLNGYGSLLKAKGDARSKGLNFAYLPEGTPSWLILKFWQWTWTPRLLILNV